MSVSLLRYCAFCDAPLPTRMRLGAKYCNATCSRSASRARRGEPVGPRQFWAGYAAAGRRARRSARRYSERATGDEQ